MEAGVEHTVTAIATVEVHTVLKCYTGTSLVLMSRGLGVQGRVFSTSKNIK